MEPSEEKEFQQFFENNPALADELINNASKILDIENQIRELPEDQPTLEHLVPGGTSSKTPGRKYERTVGLQNDILKLRGAYNEKAIKTANYTDPDKQKRFIEFI